MLPFLYLFVRLRWPTANPRTTALSPLRCSSPDFEFDGALCHCRSDLHTEPAVGHYDRPDDEACLVRRKERGDFCNFFRLRGPTYGGVFPVLGQKVTAIWHEVV